VSLQKKLMFIGAGWEQQPYIKKAIGMFIRTSTTPLIHSRNLIYVERMFTQHKPQAVLSDACDYSLLAQAYLCEKYGLPGPSFDTAVLSNNKFAQREEIYQHRIQQPFYSLCDSFIFLKNSSFSCNLPFVIKPVDGRGSLGVEKVEKEDELKPKFFESIKHSLSRQVILEQFIEGQVVSIEGLYSDKFYNLSYSTKTMHPDYPFNAMELQFPGNLEKKIVDKLYTLNEQIISAMGVKFGLTHTEFIIKKNGEIYFLEFTNRGGGVGISNVILPYITGVDICRFLITTAFGRKYGIDIKKRGYGILHFFDFGKGMLRDIKNLKNCQTIKGVLDLRITLSRGRHIPEAKTALNRHGFVIVGGKTLNDCRETIKEVEESIEIVKST